MRPRYAEVGLLRIVGSTLVAIDGNEIAKIEVTREFVAFHIVRLCRHAPRPFGIYLSCNRKVHHVAYGEIISSVAQEEAAVVVLAECREYHSRRVFLAEWEVAERYGNGQWHIGKHHIGRSRHHILSGFHLSLGELQIEVRVLVVVAGGVASVLDVVFIVFHLLGSSAGEITFALLCDYVGDESLLALEVVAHRLRFIFTARVLEHRRTLKVAHAVGASKRIHLAVVHVHLYFHRLEVNLPIGHLALSIHIGIIAAEEHQRIFGGEFHAVVEIDKTVHKPHRVALNGIGTQSTFHRSSPRHRI